MVDRNQSGEKRRVNTAWSSAHTIRSTGPRAKRSHFPHGSRGSSLLTWKAKTMATPSSLTEPTLEPDCPKMEHPAPLRAVHTTNFPALLRQLGASLLVTTYQAGKLVLVREEGDHLNTHFRTFQAPMGMALSGDRLAIGTKMQVWEYVNVPAVAARLDPPGRHDACFLPRSSHVTGNIQIHEMAWAPVPNSGL